MCLGEGTLLLQKQNNKSRGDWTHFWRTTKSSHWTTAPRCQYNMMRRIFDFLYLTEGKQKNGEHSFCKNNNKARRGGWTRAVTVHCVRFLLLSPPRLIRQRYTERRRLAPEYMRSNTCTQNVLFLFCLVSLHGVFVSVQHNGGFLLGIILLTQCYYHRGTRLNAMKRFCVICSL